MVRADRTKSPESSSSEKHFSSFLFGQRCVFRRRRVCRIACATSVTFHRCVARSLVAVYEEADNTEVEEAAISLFCQEADDIEFCSFSSAGWAIE